jgi:hypothetical protein
MRSRAADLLSASIVFAMSLAAMYLLSGGARSVMFDTFRDMAWAHNIVAGRVWSDPVLANEAFWYAPGSPLIFGLVAAAFPVGVVDIYRTSPMWWNALIPVLVFLAVRRAAGLAAGIVAVPMVFLASLWWLTHAAAPLPGIQAILVALAALLVWQQCIVSAITDSSGTCRRPACLSGLLIACTAWIHPICAVVTAGAIGFQSLYGITFPVVFKAARPLKTPVVRARLARALIWVATPSLVLSLPLMVHFILMPKVNRAPLEYFAPQLLNPDFAVQAHTPLLPVLGLVGAVGILRKRPVAAWVAGYLGVSAVGQAAGYASWLWGLPVPYLLPHEFQWHTQLALGMAAAIAVVDISRKLTERLRWPTDPGLARFMWILLMVVAVLSPVMPYMEVARNFQVGVTQIENVRSETTEWIRGNTKLDSVFACDPHDAYLFVSGLTGRKCVAVPSGHMNPAVDAASRLEDVSQLLTTEDEVRFCDLARTYGVSHVLIRLTSPETLSHARSLEQFEVLKPAFFSPGEGIVIFEVQG